MSIHPSAPVELVNRLELSSTKGVLGGWVGLPMSRGRRVEQLVPLKRPLLHLPRHHSFEIPDVVGDQLSAARVERTPELEVSIVKKYSHGPIDSRNGLELSAAWAGCGCMRYW